MVVTKDSPNRRRSIAGTSHNQLSTAPRRRRAYSIAPRTSLSPQAKARRLLVPRKSILKTSFTPDDDDESPPTQSTQAAFDDEGTQSMDFTQDFRARPPDNTSRKSFGRRVSFADHAHVRVFQIPDKPHAGNAASPHDSPSSDSEIGPSQPTDENEYPQASSARRRRSSGRFSTGSEDMDMTAILDYHPPGSAILDEEIDDGGEFSDDMDVTQAIRGDFSRKRSLSLGTTRRETLPPSAILEMEEDAPSEEGASDVDETRSSVADDSLISEVASERSQEMEFTVPLNKSLRPPAHEDEAWLALRQATHSGDTPYEPEDGSLEEDFDRPQGDMELDDAVQRLVRARESLSNQTQNDGPTGISNEQMQDDTISSMGSIDDDNDFGADNRTLNLSKVLGRVSMGAGEMTSRMSVGFGETSMDESEVYGDIVAMRRQSASRQSLLPSNLASISSTTNPSQDARPPIFLPPPPPFTHTQASTAPAQTKQVTTPNLFSFPARPTTPSKLKTTLTPSPSKSKSKAGFTAAFAPPIARPSPKKSHKRLHTDENEAENVDGDQPSSAKRQALAGKWLDATVQSQASVEPPSSPPVESTPRPRPLSPSKKSPFQSMGTQTSKQPLPSTSNVRQPSGYMARRKSLASGSITAHPTLKSPKKAGGRMSLASAPQDAWTRFDKDPHTPKKSVRVQEKVELVPQRRNETPVTEERSPPLPAQGPVVIIAEPDASPKQMPLDLSTVSNREFGDEDMVDTPPLNKTQQWRELIEKSGYDDEHEHPVISITQFISMTGIKFMDELTAPRRSIHPSQHLTRQPRDPQDIPLSQYVVAMAIDIPQLELYTRVSRDLEAWMEKSKSVFAEAEDEAAKVTPELFVEYAKADEEAQAELLHQLNFIRISTRGHAKSDWYDWKLKWVEGLETTADKAFADLESDAKKLETLSVASAEIIPGLEREYEQIMSELEKEQAEVAEIEACDQDYLNELKASIAEQNIEVEALKAEVTENNNQLKWLETRRQETEAQKQELQTSIAKAERILKIQKSSTRAEVFQLKDELEALEDLHMIRVIKVNSLLFEYIYDSTFRVTIPCKNFKPDISKISIVRLEHTRTRSKDDFPRLTNMFLSCATEILDEDAGTTVPETIHKLADYWTSCAQLRSHLRFLNVKYPVDIDIAPSSPTSMPTFRVRTTVLFPKVAGKAIISFIFNLQAFSQWPLSIDSLDCAVDVSYGPLDRNTILKAVVDRLAQAIPSDNYLFLDSCIDAQVLYE